MIIKSSYDLYDVAYADSSSLTTKSYNTIRSIYGRSPS